MRNPPSASKAMPKCSALSAGRRSRQTTMTSKTSVMPPCTIDAAGGLRVELPAGARDGSFMAGLTCLQVSFTGRVDRGRAIAGPSKCLGALSTPLHHLLAASTGAVIWETWLKDGSNRATRAGLGSDACWHAADVTQRRFEPERRQHEHAIDHLGLHALVHVEVPRGARACDEARRLGHR